MNPSESKKRRAADAAVKEVASGMVLGLGTGTTARFAIERLGSLCREGSLERLVCIPTSVATARQAEAEGLRLSDLAHHPRLDLAMDGADEVDPSLDLIKGMGGAMLDEKRVALAARRFAVFVDDSKCVARLGTQAPVPVEVAPEAMPTLIPFLASLGGEPKPRQGGAYRTDHGNAVVDLAFPGGIPDPRELARALDSHAQVKAHGLFLGMAHVVFVGHSDRVERLERVSP